jgi:hypothetical protein
MRKRVSAAIDSFLQLTRFDQIEQVDVELAHDIVQRFHRKGALSLEDIVQVGLGDSKPASQTAFGEFAAANPLSKRGNESALDVSYSHDGPIGLFPGEIG